LTVDIEGSELLVDVPFREIVEEATESFATLDLLLREETDEECFNECSDIGFNFFRLGSYSSFSSSVLLSSSLISP
jgi:hypothetical protein